MKIEADGPHSLVIHKGEDERFHVRLTGTVPDQVAEIVHGQCRRTKMGRTPERKRTIYLAGGHLDEATRALVHKALAFVRT